MLRKNYIAYVDIIEEQLQVAVGIDPIEKRKLEKDTYIFTIEIHSEDEKYARNMNVCVNTSLDVNFSCILLENFPDNLDMRELINDLNSRLRFGKLYWHQGNRNELMAQYDVILAENPSKDLFEGQIFQTCSLILRVFGQMIAEVQESVVKMGQTQGIKVSRKIDIGDVIIDPFSEYAAMRRGGKTDNDRLS